MTERAEIDFTERPAGVWWEIKDELVLVPVTSTQRVGEHILTDLGLTADEAHYLFDIFLSKAIQGDHGRGLAKFPQNVRQIRDESLPIRPVVKFVQDGPAMAVVDSELPANNWWHNILLHRAAMDISIERARTTGVALIGCRSNLVILTAQMRQAIDAGMIAFAVTQTLPIVAAYGGTKPMLPATTLAFGIPAGRHRPIILDMSITQSSLTGVILAALQGLPTPAGCLLDEFGNPTTDAGTYVDQNYRVGGDDGARGTLTPLGSSHKGYSLIFAYSLLCGVLTGTSFPWEASETFMGFALGENNRFGSLILTIDPSHFGSREQILERVDTFIDAIKAAPRREGVKEIFYPGENSQRLEEQRRAADTFSLPRVQVDEFAELAHSYGLEWP